MALLELFDKFIVERGSAAVMREHIALLIAKNDQKKKRRKGSVL